MELSNINRATAFPVMELGAGGFDAFLKPQNTDITHQNMPGGGSRMGRGGSSHDQGGQAHNTGAFGDVTPLVNNIAEGFEHFYAKSLYLEEQNRTLQEQNDQLRNQWHTNALDIGANVTSSVSQHIQNKEYKSKYISVKQERDEVIQKNSQLRGDNENLQYEVARLQENNAAGAEQVNDLQNQVTSLQHNVAHLQGRVARRDETIAYLTARLSEYEQPRRRR